MRSLAIFSQCVTKINFKAKEQSSSKQSVESDESDQEVHDVDLAVEMARYVREMKTVCGNTPGELKQDISPIQREESTIERSTPAKDNKHSSFIVHLPEEMNPKQRVAIDRAFELLKKTGCVIDTWRTRWSPPQTEKAPLINCGFIAGTDSEDDTFYRASTPVVTSSQEHKNETSDDDNTEIYEGEGQSTSPETSPVPLRRSKRIKAEAAASTLTPGNLTRFIQQLHQKCWTTK